MPQPGPQVAEPDGCERPQSGRQKCAVPPPVPPGATEAGRRGPAAGAVGGQVGWYRGLFPVPTRFWFRGDADRKSAARRETRKASRHFAGRRERGTELCFFVGPIARSGRNPAAPGRALGWQLARALGVRRCAQACRH